MVPRWTDADQTEPQGVPFRSFTLGGALLAAGYDVVFFDQEHDLDRQDRFAELAAELPECSAAFIWMNELYPSNQTHNTIRLTDALKATSPELPVVVGGELISILPPEFFDIDTQVDYFLRGYGEDSALHLIDHLHAGTDPDDVAGLVWRDAAGTLRHQQPESTASFRPEFLELYDRLDLSCYIQTGGVLGNDQPTLTLSTGRGCAKGCRFCGWSNHRPKFMDAQPTFELMSRLRNRYQVRQFHIAELDFFTDKKRALQLAGLLEQHQPDIVWFALGSPIDMMKFDDAEWDQLRDGGLRKVEMGSESGSPTLLRAIGKPHVPEDIYTTSVKMIERGIVPMNNFLFGFPGETRQDRLASLQMIERLLQVSYSGNHLTYRHYQPVWGTGCGDECLSHSPEGPKDLLSWVAEREKYPDEATRTMHWLPAEDERELKLLINHDLPLATSRLSVGSWWRRRIYHKLRHRAQRALRSGLPVRDLDRWLYQRVVARPLDVTYVP